MKIKIFYLLFFLLISKSAFADIVPYAKTLKLKVETENYIIIHFHDWTDKTNNERYEMMTTDQNPFTSKNNYAYLECIDKKTGKTIFRKPSTALTKIQVSEDEKYIIGISKIMIDNPYQLIIYSTDEELIKKRHISSKEAKLSKMELKTFIEKYPKQYNFLKSSDRIYSVSDTTYISSTHKELIKFIKKYPKQYSIFISFKPIYSVAENTYIDFLSMDMSKKIGDDAWRYLFNYFSNNHLSNYFSESVTNWVFWFYEEDPNIRFKYISNQLNHIEILDPNKQNIEIKIKE